MIRFLVVLNDIKKSLNPPHCKLDSTYLTHQNTFNFKPVCTGVKLACKLLDQASKYGGLGGN